MPLIPSFCKREPDGDLFHKTPYNRIPNIDAPPIITANLDLNFPKLLRESIHRDMREVESDVLTNTGQSPLIFDEVFSLSPLSSPTPTPPSTPLLNPPSFDKIFSLSPLSSPTPTPPSTPLPCAENLPEISEAPAPENALTVRIEDPPNLGDIEIPASRLPEPLYERIDSATQPSHKARHRARIHLNRKEKRQREREQVFSHHRTRPNMQKRHSATKPISSSLRTENSSAAAKAFVGTNDRVGRKKLHPLKDLTGENSHYRFKYVAWDGNISRQVSDSKGWNVAFLAGHPEDEDWPALVQQAADALESHRSHLIIPKHERVHRRGAFPAVRCGISHGGGSKHPNNLKNSEQNAAVVEELNRMKPFRRLAGFASSVMADQAPDLYEYYIDRLAQLHVQHPDLKRLFPSSIFAAVSYNFGPRTVCYKHKDFANLPFGLCAITALGSFDHRKGGHLILWECHLVIEFPPGSTILLPSAIIAHSNVPIQKDERRYSFAQYTAGGLFRWVEHGFKLTEEYYGSLSKEELEVERKKDEERWEFGLSLFPKAKAAV